MIKSVQLLLIGFTFFILGCSNSDEQSKKIDLPNFNSESIIHLQKHQSLDHVSSISLNIKGRFNGHTELWLGISDSIFNRKYDYKNGIVELKFAMGDWYNDACYVKLVPVESSKGNIEFTYTFH